MRYFLRKRKASENDVQALPKRAKIASNKTNARPNSMLLSLPAELRNEIYEWALLDQQDESIRLSIGFYDDWIKSWQEPALLRVCKTVRKEASPFYYCFRAFEIRVRRFPDLDEVTNWIRGMVARCGNKPFKEFTISIKYPRTKSLECFFPMVQMYYETDLQLNARPLPANETAEATSLNRNASESFFRFPRIAPGDLTYTTLLENAIALGKRARKEGWHMDALEVEFGLLVYRKRCENQAGVLGTWLKEQREKREG